MSGSHHVPIESPRAGRRRACLRAVAAGAAVALGGRVAAADARSEAAAPFDWPRLVLLDGTTVEPGDWRDQAAVLVLWATHCPFCLRHNANIETLYRAATGRPLRVMTAALDDDAARVRRYMADHRYTFPVTMQAEMLRTRLGLRRVIPTTCTFDRSGRLLQRIPGEMAADDVLGLIELASAPPSAAKKTTG
jgi:hypothetical protein